MSDAFETNASTRHGRLAVSPIVCAFAVLSALAVRAADPISQATAKKLTITAKESVQDVTLFQSGTNLEQVCYYKMTLSKGKQYTLWLEDESPDRASIAIESAEAEFSSDWDTSEPGAFFEQATYGQQVRWVFTGEGWTFDTGSEGWSDGSTSDWGDDWGDDWEWDEPTVPSSWTYYIVIRGQPGATAKLHAVAKIAVPEGVSQNPKVLVPTLEEQETPGLVFCDDRYYLSMKVAAGQRYYIATRGGTDEHDLEFADLTVAAAATYGEWASPNNDARVFIPDSDMTCVFDIHTEGGADMSLKPTVRYRKDDVRTIAQHTKTPLTVGETVVCRPGYKNLPGSGAYDPIIDEALYSFVAEKGASYVIETEGSEESLEMVVYDSSGKIVKSNTSLGRGSLDVRCTLESVTKKATYYVGVCEALEEFSDDTPSYLPVNLSIRRVTVTGGEAADAVPLDVTPGAEADDVFEEAAGQGPYELGADDWYRTFSVAGYADMACRLGVSLSDPSAGPGEALRFEVYYLSGKVKKGVADLVIAPGGSANVTFAKNATYYVRVSVSGGVGLDCAPFLIHALGYMTETGDCGGLTVSAKGADGAMWSLLTKSASGKYVAGGVTYPNGTTLVLPVGDYAVRYASVKGFSAPVDHEVTVSSGETVRLDGDYYSDTSDHKDDVASGATKWTLKNTATSFTRTLWPDDPADYFAFDGKDGYLYDFALADVDDDAVFSIYNGTTLFAEDVTQVTQLELPKASAKYYLVVKHGNDTPGGGKYTLSGRFANVGAISFAKTAVSAKDTATSVSLTVNRSAKDGAVRVSYATVDGTARAGEQYESQTGLLEWADGDKKAKTITIKLIPKLIAAYNDGNHDFTIELADAGGDYPAPITTPSATVTLTETSRQAVTAESVYAKKAPKLATVKTEDGALRGGTFFGVVQAEEGSLTNGLPELASVTLTVSAKGGVGNTSKDTLSAKVSLAGKSYTFKTASKEKPWDEESETEKKKTLELVTTVNKIKCTNTLELAVFDGATTDATAWLKALATAKLTMNVPDANGKGVQKDVVYTGSLYRQNAKIQAYLTAVTNFTGYYTVALANANANEKTAPAGHGYLTLTVDNKGTVKVAGLLADSTKLSFSVTASALENDGDEYAMRVPLFAAKSPYCFGGEIVLRRREIVETHPDGKGFDVLAGLPEDGELVWNNDNAKLTYAGQEGWALSLQPVGGWYDTVFNLQNYYRDYALSVSTADISEFPKEALATGYDYVSTTFNDPNGYPAELVGDALSIAKKSLVKNADKKTYDLDNSVNPFNVQAKLARATGVVTGSFSLWSQDGSGKQKEITGIKHNGIVLLQRDASGILDENDLTAGFFNLAVKMANVKPSRTWTVSKPFNLRLSKAEDE